MSSQQSEVDELRRIDDLILAEDLESLEHENPDTVFVESCRLGKIEVAEFFNTAGANPRAHDDAAWKAGVDVARLDVLEWLHDCLMIPLDAADHFLMRQALVLSQGSLIEWGLDRGVVVFPDLFRGYGTLHGPALDLLPRIIDRMNERRPEGGWKRRHRYWFDQLLGSTMSADRIDLMELLLDNSLATTRSGENPWDCLSFGVAGNEVRAVDWLLRRDPKPPASTLCGLLHLAMHGGHHEMVNVLRLHGAVEELPENTNSQDEGESEEWGSSDDEENS